MPIVRNKIFATNTAEYTVIDLKQEMMECVNILINLGYEVHIPTKISINKRLKKALGRCNKNRGIYNIEINETYLRVGNPQNIHNTIMHECIHCVEGCFNHGPKWKAVANKVSQLYPQYSINRASYDKEYGKVLEEGPSSYKYQIVCGDCGCKMDKYKRWSKTLESIFWAEEKYQCGRCKSRKLIVVDL